MQGLLSRPWVLIVSLLHLDKIGDLIPRGTDLQLCSLDFQGVGCDTRSGAVMQEGRQCPTCGLSCVGKTIGCVLPADGRGEVIHSSKMKTPDIWCSLFTGSVKMAEFSCKIWFDVQSLCPASLNSCGAVWSLAGPNSHLNCTALGLRQLLYAARILSLL